MLTLSADDLADGGDDLLFVRGRPGAVVRACIEDDHARLQEAAAAQCNSAGIAAIGLRQFIDTVRSSLSPALRMTVEVDSARAAVALVLARYECQLVSVESVVDGSTSLLELTFKESKAFRGRVARFWSVTRPWEGPADLPIDDDDGGHALFLVHGRLQPGRYLVEVVVAAVWDVPRRPADLSLYGHVQIGSIADERRRLVSLDPDDPLTALELYLADPPRTVTMTAPAAIAVARQALLAFVYQIAGLERPDLSAPAVRVTRQVLFTVPEAAAEALVDLAESNEVRADLLRRAAMAMVPDFLDCPPIGTSARTIDSLWAFSSFVGAAADSWRASSDGAAVCSRWLRNLGWDPATLQGVNPATWPGHIQGLEGPILCRTAEQVRQITDAVGQDGPLLTRSGTAAALLAWLEARIERGDAPFEAWQSRYHLLNDERVRHGFGKALLEDATALGSPGAWARFPQDLLASALSFVQAPDGSQDAPRALGALWEASALTPQLTELALLNAIVVYRLE